MKKLLLMAIAMVIGVTLAAYGQDTGTTPGAGERKEVREERREVKEERKEVRAAEESLKAKQEQLKTDQAKLKADLKLLGQTKDPE
ncbi:MAG TPA: hypothetical protein PLG31_17060, partial [Spirochaetota bacterium]|nr:hypothetical protein [Spirochaetota bacterium]